MLDGEDKDRIAEIVEADAIVADAKANSEVRHLEGVHIAFASGEVTSSDMQDAERCSWSIARRSALAGQSRQSSWAWHWPGA